MIGLALMRQFGWKADLRNPNIEIFMHLSDAYSVVGIPLLRMPLASRTYIQTAGLRSTIAWAMASIAEIKVPSGPDTWLCPGDPASSVDTSSDGCFSPTSEYHST